jgi:hypothetical protein
MVRSANEPPEIRIPALSRLVDHGRLPVDDDCPRFLATDVYSDSAFGLRRNSQTQP